LNALVTDLLTHVRHRIQAEGILTLEAIRHAPNRLATFSPAMEAERMTAKRFLYANLYNSSDMEAIHAEAAKVIEELFAWFITNPDLLPEDHRVQVHAEGLARTVTDYIAGMTDSFIEQTWARLAL
jgi:dGTPase